MAIFLPNHRFKNGTMVMGPYSSKPEGDKMKSFKEHVWQFEGRSAYLYMTGEIPENELAPYREKVRSRVLGWPEQKKG